MYLRASAMVLAAVLVLGCFFQLLIGAFFVVGFGCDRTCHPSHHPMLVTLLTGAPVLILLTAIGLWYAIDAERPRIALLSYAAHAVSAAGLLTYWLYLSYHSDGDVLWAIAAYEVPGGLALLLFLASTWRSPHVTA